MYFLAGVDGMCRVRLAYNKLGNALTFLFQRSNLKATNRRECEQQSYRKVFQKNSWLLS